MNMIMSRERIAELAEGYRATKNADLRNEIVDANYGLISKAARTYLGKNLTDRGIKMESEDILAEGAIGLMNAAEHFKLDEGVEFSTFAYKCIRTRIGRAIEEQSRVIRLSSNMQNLIREWKRVARLLKNEYERTPDNHEVAEWLIKNCKLKSQKWSHDLAADVVKAMILKTATSDEVLQIIPIEEETKSYEEETQMEQVLDELKFLPEPYKEAVRLSYFEHLGLDDIAKILGIKKHKAGILIHSGIEMIKANLGLDFNEKLISKIDLTPEVDESNEIPAFISIDKKESERKQIENKEPVIRKNEETKAPKVKTGKLPRDLSFGEQCIIYYNYRNNGGTMTFMKLEEHFGLHLSQGNTAMRICKIVSDKLKELKKQKGA